MSKTIRYEMQWDEDTHQLAERAARAAGLGSIKAYVSQLIQQHAPETLQTYNQVKLSNAEFDAFCQACDSPQPVSHKLKRAAQKLDQEGFSLDEQG
ncbi:hypothetical protein GCM10011403_08270 [Pseudohongiella nitratireducens]|jgi:uncharacterized protein (DUF1778 family)|uniref:DUF1778 domain-containing protein n=1 Tax=Pseudohongiella nitratireducens TaxID=1768907 RepID=A0A917GQ04_9GAMM|nr:DUF1778 domain-containing protein [Pseudohongiella nitratireducens]MDF1623460.1 DUF1778 domain-containing protein [Pseudohongiella nitratireducens]GGG53463.1 hypothetical protein GCM10011403_08270 [Pseudohongiella nitratireducens]|tara:strand:+ start:1250 stop:1537 length:288 start_codon:yes stop_codon:yes gene_type:complete